MNNVYPIHVKRSVPQPFKVITMKYLFLTNTELILSQIVDRLYV